MRCLLSCVLLRLAWVEAAEALPATLADLEDVLGRLGQDDDFQAQFARDPHAALRQAGLPATPDVVAAVRLSTSGQRPSN